MTNDNYNFNGLNFTPMQVIISGSALTCIFAMVFYQLEIFRNNNYFSFGVPVKVFNREITNQNEFYILLICFALNKMMSTMITEVVYNWIINVIHDPKSQSTYGYSKTMSLIIVLLNSIHLSVNSLFTINGVHSQISFLLVELLGNCIVIVYVNNKYIQNKEKNLKMNNDMYLLL